MQSVSSVLPKLHQVWFNGETAPVQWTTYGVVQRIVFSAVLSSLRVELREVSECQIILLMSGVRVKFACIIVLIVVLCDIDIAFPLGNEFCDANELSYVMPLNRRVDCR